jgi:hypothetical protein
MKIQNIIKVLWKIIFEKRGIQKIAKPQWPAL